MKHLKGLIIVLFLLGAEMSGTPLIVRTGAVNKPFQVLVWATLGYNQTGKIYEWGQEKFIKLDTSINTGSADLMAAVGLPGKIELGGVVPLGMKSKGNGSSKGVGDVLLIGRYGIFSNPLLPVRAALSLGISLPTGYKNPDPDLTLGDGSTDIGLGLAVNTAKLAVVVAHLRGAYWFNGKSNDTTKLGNMLEYLVGLDFLVMPKLTPQLAFSGYRQEEKEVNGDAQPNTQVNRGLFNLLLLYQPLPKITVRPKVSIPIPFLCQGGKIADSYLGLDLWVTVP